MKKLFYCLIVLLFSCSFVTAQEKLIVDTTGKVLFSKNTVGKKDSSTKKYDPGIAIRRSAMLPGWGQFTNKKYWKIPLVYAGIGIPAYLFTRNLKQYRDAKEAFTLATDSDPSNDDQIKEPYFSVRAQPDRIRVFRNSVRQNVDYSVIFFIIFWGLNVADAAVDANLKTFDVSDELSLQLKPGFSPLANTNGISLVLNIGKRK
ncbi:MAG: DUF5683 domain-containing protein [Ferruginibacter sp.]|nr:DUF5683 domain-containing protein [Ferruginibacter sp.]